MMMFLGTRYDPKDNAVVLKFFDPNSSSRRVFVIKDKEFKPFFFVEGSIDRIEKLLQSEQVKNRVLKIEKVRKFDRVTMKERELVKVIVNNPLDVRVVREFLKNHGFKTFEDTIKFYLNYIYEKDLVPGAFYKRFGSTFVPLKDYNNIKVLFEEEIPIPDYVAFDIEVWSERKIPQPDDPKYPVISVAVSRNKVTKVYVLASHYKRRGGLTKQQLRELLKENIKVVVVESECELIERVLKELISHDVFVGFNSDLFDLPYLLNRYKYLKCENKELIEKFVVVSKTKHVVTDEEYLIIEPDDSIHFDLFQFFGNSSIHNYTFGKRYKETTLDSIAEALLGERKVKIDKEISELSIYELVKYNAKDAQLTAKLFEFESFLPWKMVILISRISKLPVWEVNRSKIARWIGSLFNYVHRKRNYLIPNKEVLEEKGKEAVSRSKVGSKKYRGAEVVDPPTGIFFGVTVLDFASLYPSLIEKRNLSYETVNPFFPCKRVEEVPEVGHKVCLDVKGISSEIVGMLKSIRLEYKRKAKTESDKKRKEIYNNIQMTLKVLINAMYGVFGNEHFDYFCLPVAESVTAYARYVLTSALTIIRNKYHVPILYGDTDSFFVWTTKNEIINKIIDEIKDRFNLELEVDKTFKLILFSSLKKNYVGVTNDGELVIKGLKGIKRDTPKLIREAFLSSLEFLKTVEKPEDIFKVKEMIVSKYNEVLKKLESRNFTLEDIVVKQQMTKSIEEYKVLPKHVKAGLLLAKKKGIKLTKGTIIEYVETYHDVLPVELVSSLNIINVKKYKELTQSTFSQIEPAFGGFKKGSTLLSYFTSTERSKGIEMKTLAQKKEGKKTLLDFFK